MDIFLHCVTRVMKHRGNIMSTGQLHTLIVIANGQVN